MDLGSKALNKKNISILKQYPVSHSIRTAVAPDTYSRWHRGSLKDWDFDVVKVVSLAFTFKTSSSQKVRVLPHWHWIIKKSEMFISSEIQE